MVEGFVRRSKPSQGRIRHDIRVDRYWKSKRTGIKVEVKRLLLVDNVRLQVIFYDEERKAEFSLSLEQMQEQYEPAGNTPGHSERSVTHKKKFDLNTFNGNPGDIVFDIPRKRKEYDLLQPHQKKILHAIKLCKLANINFPDIDLIGEYAVNQFQVENWEYHFAELKKADFFIVASGNIILADSSLGR